MRDRKSTSPGPAFHAFAAVVLCVQLLPAGIPVAAGLAHGIYHFSDTLSLDYLVYAHSHGHDHADPSTHRLDGVGPHAHDSDAHGHVHEHVEDRAHAAAPSTHEHSRAVDLLLEVAGDDGVSDIGPPTTPDRGLDLHLPTAPVHLASSIVGPGVVAADRATSLLVATRPPDPPPPRA